MTDLFSSLPRGIRNNNWLNIKFNPRNQWLGQCGISDGFCIFKSPEYGIRAACIIIKNYLKRSPGLTVHDFIYKWSSTDQRAYVAFVCRESQISSSVKLTDLSYQQLYTVLYWMCIFEVGCRFSSKINRFVICEGINLSRVVLWKK